MTKVGKGDLPPKKSDLAAYQKEIQQSALKFENALQSYLIANKEEKVRLKAIMDDQLHLIQEAVREVKRAGVSKQEVKIEADYKQFLTGASDEAVAALQHDLQTLRDFTTP